MRAEASRRLVIEEHRQVPWDGALLGYGAAAVFPLAAIWLWLPGPAPDLVLRGVQLWGAAILMFLGGVRRGLSFRTEGGPRTSQMVAMAWLFAAGLLAVILPPVWAFALLVVGYASLLAVDPAAARDGAVPLYFARLRPAQMALAVIGLVVILVRAWAMPV